MLIHGITGVKTKMAVFSKDYFPTRTRTPYRSTGTCRQLTLDPPCQPPPWIYSNENMCRNPIQHPRDVARGSRFTAILRTITSLNAALDSLAPTYVCRDVLVKDGAAHWLQFSARTRVFAGPLTQRTHVGEFVFTITRGRVM